MKAKQWILKNKASCLCVVVTLFLYLLLQATSGYTGMEGGKLLRNAPGEGQKNYPITVTGLDQGEVELEIPVDEISYEAEKVEQAFEQAIKELPDLMLGENESLSLIRHPLNLPTTWNSFISIKWVCDQPEKISQDGLIYTEEVEETGEDILLMAYLSYGDYEQIAEFDLVLYPVEVSSEEREQHALLRQIEALNKEQLYNETLTLPEEFEGRLIQYSPVKEYNNELFLLLGLLAAVLLKFREKEQEKQKKKIRDRQMLFDYSEVVSKFMVLIGAGMTIRSAWEKVVFDYHEAVTQGRKKERFVYEEMSKTVFQLKNGMPESQAYSEFGRRCGLQPYLKLSSLLEQNKRAGMKHLKTLMEMEMTLAFEQRKMMAKRLGEEATTKMVLPLILVLGVVMVMITVPAFLSFY